MSDAGSEVRPAAGAPDSGPPDPGTPDPETPEPETQAAASANSDIPKPEIPDAGAADLGRDQGSSDLGEDERAELARLRTEVADLRGREADLRSQETDLRTREAELRGQEAAVAARGRRHRMSWRTPVASVLIVIGCVLAPISVVAVWTANQVSDTNRYIANIEPLIHDPAVQGALTDKVTVAITSHLNLVGYTNQAADLLNSKGLSRVSTLLKTFGPALANAVAGYIHTQVSKIVTSPQFAHTWIQMNTVAHQQLVKALSGQGPSAVSVSNGQVVLDLTPFIAVVKQALVARGFSIIDKLPPIHPQLALFSSKDLVRAQTLYRLINDLKIVLPILCLLLIAAGVYIARSHRRALIGAGLGFAASMLVLGLGLLIFRGIYLNTVPNSTLPSNAAAVIFDTFVRFIREALRTLLVLGLVVAIGAFFAGPSVSAVKARGAVKSGFNWIRGAGERRGVSTGPVGRWTYRYRQALRIGAVFLVALLFVFWGRPTAAVVIWLAVLLLVLLGLIELIGRPPARPEVASQP